MSFDTLRTNGGHEEYFPALSRKTDDKVMTAAQAVRELVSDGVTLGIGGQTLGRVTMALAHEIIRQGVKDITLVGCSMSMSMDMLVGAGLVKRTECGTGNLERIGTTMRWRRAIEEGRLEIEDYSHLGMASRFLAGSLGLPFMPSKSMLGTDIVNKKGSNGRKTLEIIDNPWEPGDPVVLVPAVNPDVSIIHAQKADRMGNVVIEGFTTHEVEMAKASDAVIVSCEELIDTDEVRSDSDRTSIPYIYVDAVVVQPWGAYPTSTHRHYVQDEDHLAHYQAAARAGGEAYDEYLRKAVYDHATFDGFLESEVGPARLEELRATMQTLI
jgi:acyl CoA:acetate/3-ketoacid CoA transferase alpha subunit